MRSYVRTFKCENVNVRSVRNEDCESGYVRSRPYIPICEPEGRDHVQAGVVKRGKILFFTETGNNEKTPNFLVNLRFKPLLTLTNSPPSLQ